MILIAKDGNDFKIHGGTELHLNGCMGCSLLRTPFLIRVSASIFPSALACILGRDSSLRT